MIAEHLLHTAVVADVVIHGRCFAQLFLSEYIVLFTYFVLAILYIYIYIYKKYFLDEKYAGAVFI